MPLDDDPNTCMRENEIKFLKYFRAKYRGRQTEIIKVRDMDLLVERMVVAPVPETMPHLTLDRLANFVCSKTVLDMGCGCGINGIFAALNGATHVTAVDIDPVAVRNTQQNIQRFHLQDRMEVVLSNVFDNVRGKYDVIVANLPIAEVNPLNGHEQAWSIISRFLSGLKGHLIETDGRAFLFCVSFADPKVFDIIKGSNLVIEQTTTDNEFGVKFYLYELACIEKYNH